MNMVLKVLVVSGLLFGSCGPVSATLWDFTFTSDGFSPVGGGIVVSHENGQLTCDVRSPHAGIVSPQLLGTIPAEQYGELRLSLRSSVDQPVTFYWADESGTFSDSRSVPFGVSGGTELRDYRIKLSSHALWRGNVTRFRFNFGKVSIIGIDFVDMFTGLYLYRPNQDGEWSEAAASRQFFNPSYPTFLLVHGWNPDNLETLEEIWVTNMAIAFRERMTIPTNVLAWNWLEEAQGSLRVPANKVPGQAELLSNSLNNFFELVGSPQDFHILGHSLGAFMAADLVNNCIQLHQPGSITWFPKQLTLFDPPTLSLFQPFMAGDELELDTFISAIRTYSDATPGVDIFIELYDATTNVGSHGVNLFVDLPFSESGFHDADDWYQETVYKLENGQPLHEGLLWEDHVAVWEDSSNGFYPLGFNTRFEYLREKLPSCQADKLPILKVEYLWPEDIFEARVECVNGSSGGDFTAAGVGGPDPETEDPNTSGTDSGDSSTQAQSESTADPHEQLALETTPSITGELVAGGVGTASFTLAVTQGQVVLENVVAISDHIDLWGVTSTVVFDALDLGGMVLQAGDSVSYQGTNSQYPFPQNPSAAILRVYVKIYGQDDIWLVANTLDGEPNALQFETVAQEGDTAQDIQLQPCDQTHISSSVDLSHPARGLCFYNETLFGAIETGGFVIVDSHNPDNLFQVGSGTYSGALAQDACVIGNGSHVVVPDSGGFARIHSLENIVSPEFVASISLTCPLGALSIPEKNLVTFGENYAGFTLADVSNPQQPLILGGLPLEGTIYNLAYYKDNLFVPAGGLNGFHVVDIQNPESPFVVGFVDVGVYVDRLVVDKSQLYVVSCRSELHCFDISIPEAPELLGATSVPGKPVNLAVLVSENTVGTVGEKFCVVDVTNPASPEVIEEHDLPGQCEGIAVTSYGVAVSVVRPPSILHFRVCGIAPTETETEAVVETTQQEITQEESQTEPEVQEEPPVEPEAAPTPCNQGTNLGSVSGLQLAKGVSVDEARKKAYVAGKAGVWIIDLENPSLPVLAIASTGGYAQDVCYYKDHIYAAVGNLGVKCFNVSDPASPVSVGTMQTNSALGLIAVDDVLYVADNFAGFTGFGIANPENPVPFGGLQTQGTMYNLAKKENILYCPGATSGVHLINVSDPSSPTLIFTLSSPGYSDRLFVYSNILFVVSYNTGLHLYDVTISDDPVPLGSTQVPGRDVNMAVSGTKAYLVGEQGVQVVDFSEATNPQVVDQFDLPSRGEGIAIFGTTLAASVESSGSVYLYEVCE